MTLTFTLGQTSLRPDISVVYWNAYLIRTNVNVTLRPGTNNEYNTNIIFNHAQDEHILVILDDDIRIQEISLLQTTFVSLTNDELRLPLFNNTNSNIIIPAGTIFAEVIGVQNSVKRAITLYDYNLQKQQQIDTNKIVVLAGIGNILIQTYADSDFNSRITNSTYVQTDLDLNRYDPEGHMTNYGIELIGYIYPEYTETYTFYITSKDKIRFWINHQLLLYDWDTATDTEQTSSTIALNANTYYPLYIQQAEIAGDNQKLLVKWESASQTKETIPKDKLATHDHQDSWFINNLQVADNLTIFNSTTTTEKSIKLNTNTTGELQFKSNGTDIGYLSTTSNNTLMNFTGQHRSYTNNTNINTTPNNYIGLIVSTTGTLKNLNDASTTVDNAIPVVDLSSADNDKKVFGVISGRESSSEDRTFQIGIYSSKFTKNTDDERLFINSVGEGMVWISDKGGNLTNGDLITTSTAAGYGQLQSDDFIHNYTLGKITQDCDFDSLTITRWIDLSGNEISQSTYDANPALGHRTFLCGCVYYCG